MKKPEAQSRPFVTPGEAQRRMESRIQVAASDIILACEGRLSRADAVACARAAARSFDIRERTGR